MYIAFLYAQHIYTKYFTSNVIQIRVAFICSFFRCIILIYNLLVGLAHQNSFQRSARGILFTQTQTTVQKEECIIF